MKKITLIVLVVLSLGHVLAQSDKNGNPIFNSIKTGERSVDNVSLLSNYYTLKNNIENKESSVFIAQNPSLDQIEEAAIDLASDFFYLTKESKVVVMIMLHTNPTTRFMVVTMSTQQLAVFPCTLNGVITENRAREIIKERYDTMAKIENGKLTFRGKEFVIISSQAIEEAVLKLIKDEKLDKKEPSDITIRSGKELRSYILKETREGGKLDAFSQIKGKENDGVQIKPGLFATRQSVALYKWGRACFDLGVLTLDSVYEIYTEFKGKELNHREKEYLKMGFTKELDK